MSTSWKEQLKEQLIQQYGNKNGLALSKKYLHGFSSSYMDDYSVAVGLSDIKHMENLSKEHTLVMDFYLISQENETSLHLRLLQWQKIHSAF